MSESSYKGTLNLTNIQEVLSFIFFGDIDSPAKKYIVPLQGNFFNPTGDSDISAWIGYAIGNKSTTSSSSSIDPATGAIYRECIADITLTFIGANAEGLASTVLFWNDRSDVRKILDDYYKGQLNHKPISIKSSMYMQEGLNNTLCWTTQVNITYNESTTTPSAVLQNVDGLEGDIHGKLIIGGK